MYRIDSFSNNDRKKTYLYSVVCCSILWISSFFYINEFCKQKQENTYLDTSNNPFIFNNYDIDNRIPVYFIEIGRVEMYVGLPTNLSDRPPFVSDSPTFAKMWCIWVIFPYNDGVQTMVQGYSPTKKQAQENAAKIYVVRYNVTRHEWANILSRYKNKGY